MKTRFYNFLYPAYWYYIFNRKGESSAGPPCLCYYSARPNPGAGIGHQLANWTAGMWYADLFGVRYATMPFSNQKWEELLGLNSGETMTADLVKNHGYETRKLPLFLWHDAEGLELNKRIVHSYCARKVVLIAEQDQYYMEQHGVMDRMKMKFWSASSRRSDKLLYDASHVNIAVHVRRTVVIDSKTINESEEIKKLRFLDADYYREVLKNIISGLGRGRPVSIFIFSTVKDASLGDLEDRASLHYCHDMDEYRAFLHMVYADILVTSKSGFSYAAALIGNGIKVCPKHFWHGYPDLEDWILADSDGSLVSGDFAKVARKRFPRAGDPSHA